MTQPGETPPPAEAPGEQPKVSRERLHHRAGRYGRQTGQFLWVALLVAAAVFVVILIVENTRRVRVGWVFGYSRISLVYLVVVAVVLGWFLGIATSVLLRRRMRRTLGRREGQPQGR